MCHKSWLFSHQQAVCKHSLFLSVCVQDTQADAGIHTTIRRLMHAYYYYDQVKASNALGHTTYTCDNLPTVRWLITLLRC